MPPHHTLELQVSACDLVLRTTARIETIRAIQALNQVPGALFCDTNPICASLH